MMYAHVCMCLKVKRKPPKQKITVVQQVRLINNLNLHINVHYASLHRLS